MKTRIHFTHSYIVNPTNPITLNLIGAGGTGSHMLTVLARLNGALNALGHAGFQVNLWDDDIVNEANLYRQQFTYAEVGLNKAVARISHINRHYGLNWKAIPEQFQRRNIPEEKLAANLTISCVDKVRTRFDIADLLQELSLEEFNVTKRPLYWMDFGNGQYNGQLIISTIQPVPQSKSKQFQPIPDLPAVTTEFKDLLLAQVEDDQPSCSQAESLEKQDLFINSLLAQQGGILLSGLIRKYMTSKRGVFMNLEEMTCVPVPV